MVVIVVLVFGDIDKKNRLLFKADLRSTSEHIGLLGAELLQSFLWLAVLQFEENNEQKTILLEKQILQYVTGFRSTTYNYEMQRGY